MDTHKHTHHGAAVDQNGLLRSRVAADTLGGADQLRWLRSHGQVQSIGIERTRFNGAVLTRFLSEAGERVIEVNRPNQVARRADGKSDRLEAEQVARSVLGETATALRKAGSGPIEVIRMLRGTRSSAVKSRTQAFNALHGIMVGAPAQLRDELVKLAKRTLVNRCLRPRPEADELRTLIDREENLLLAGAAVAGPPAGATSVPGRLTVNRVTA